MGKIYLDGYIDVPEDQYKEVEEALKVHVELTLKEQGCEKFSVTPSQDTKDRFDVSEVFSSKESFNNHQKRVASSDWGALTKNFERHYSVKEH